jgi:hypothetical protein
MAAIMTELTYLFAIAAVLAGALASITVWSPRRLSLKVSALATSVLLLPTAYAGFLQLLSMPKPVGLEWWHARAEEATVLGSSIHEEAGIYLWLQLEGVPEPRAYVLPWSRQLAQQLQEAQREAEEQQGELRMRLPFEPSWDDDEPQFYAMPQPALPPKDYEQEPPTQFPPAPGQEA